ncbi:hypothetical protein AHF37_09053 [Paragonimus kellicotti]|nr:hypothetical protein AHF37_09053 [Paragonimus kellicotti]
MLTNAALCNATRDYLNGDDITSSASVTELTVALAPPSPHTPSTLVAPAPTPPPPPPPPPSLSVGPTPTVSESDEHPQSGLACLLQNAIAARKMKASNSKIPTVSTPPSPPPPPALSCRSTQRIPNDEFYQQDPPEMGFGVSTMQRHDSVLSTPKISLTNPVVTSVMHEMQRRIQARRIALEAAESSVCETLPVQPEELQAHTKRFNTPIATSNVQFQRVIPSPKPLNDGLPSRKCAPLSNLASIKPTTAHPPPSPNQTVSTLTRAELDILRREIIAELRREVLLAKNEILDSIRLRKI